MAVAKEEEEWQDIAAVHIIHVKSYIFTFYIYIRA